MSLHWLVLVITTLCISSHMHLVQSRLPSLNPFRYGKLGFGACPKVTSMKDYDITKMYGKQWFLIAHYSEEAFLDRHCTSQTFSDANPGADICRISMGLTTVIYNGQRISGTIPVLMPNETDHSTWIDTLNNVPVMTNVIATDYDKYLLVHECNEFPRDNPLIYEQINYISSTQAVWEGGLKDFQEALAIFEGIGIDTAPFILHDQKDCKSPPEGPEPLAFV